MNFKRDDTLGQVSLKRLQFSRVDVTLTLKKRTQIVVKRDTSKFENFAVMVKDYYLDISTLYILPVFDISIVNCMIRTM